MLDDGRQRLNSILRNPAALSAKESLKLLSLGIYIVSLNHSLARCVPERV